MLVGEKKELKPISLPERIMKEALENNLCWQISAATVRGSFQLQGVEVVEMLGFC